MSASAVLTRSMLSVTPGDQATIEVKVRNTGTIVDELSFAVVGDASEWAVVEPLSVSLLPEGEATATVRFSPPAEPAPPAGEVPFAIAVSCREDKKGGTAEEGTLEVLVRSSLAAEVVPRTASGALGDRVEIAVDNRGNSDVVAELTAIDPNSALVFAIHPYELPLAAGTAGFVRMRIRPAKRFWWGPDQTRPYSVTAIPEEGEPCDAGGTFVQKSILPKWTPKAIAGLVAALLLLALLWLTVLKPAIGDEVDHEVAEQLKAAGITPAGGGGGGDDGGTDSGQGTDQGVGDLAAGGGFDRRLTTGGGIDVPEGQVLKVSDLVFSNPGAQQGTVLLRRGDEVLLQLTLANFRDVDYHFVSPIVVPGGSRLSFEVAGCVDPPPAPDLPAGVCGQVAVFVDGSLG